MNLSEFYKKVILDHAKNKRNHRKMDAFTHKIHYKNPTCGDVMTMYARINDEETLEDVSFIGEGCFISMASSSMFTIVAKGRTVKELQELSLLMNEMILNGKETEDERLEDMICFKDIHKLPARYNCVLMPWQALEKLIKAERT